MIPYEDFILKERIYFQVGLSFAGRKNMTYLVRKTVRQYLSEPYGQCNRYESREQISRTQCYRQCIQNQYNNRYNCVPIFIDYYNHDLDLKYLKNRPCEQLFNSTELPMKKEIREKCHSKCHKECHQIEYKSTLKESESVLENKDWFKNWLMKREIAVQLDTEEPMFRYTEEPVLTFTSYLVYCGGLMGLWFGASAHDIIAIIFGKLFQQSCYQGFVNLIIEC